MRRTIRIRRGVAPVRINLTIPAAFMIASALALTGLSFRDIPAAQPLSASVVISQVYPGGGGATGTYKNDYVELFNRSIDPVVLAGYSLQYGSSTGQFGSSSANIYAFPTGTTIPGSSYLLVQLGAAGSVTTPVPSPDLTTGGLSMAAGSGKIALANTTTPLGCGAIATPCALPHANIVDLVAYGTSNNGEGGTTVNNGAAFSSANTQGAVRKSSGCTETDDNNADFDVVINPVPRNSFTAPSPCGANDAQPTVGSTTPADNATNVAPGSNITITFREPVNVTGNWFMISCASTGTHAAVVSGGPTTFTLDPDADFGSNELCTVTVVASQVTDQDANDPPDAMQGNYVFDFTSAPILPTLSVNDVSLSEGSGPGVTAFTFNVSLSSSTHGGVTFDIATADGAANPATAGSDYTARSLTGQTIPNGSNSYSFTVDVTRDASFEQNETFFVNVTNITGATAGDAQGLGTILNDDTGICGDAFTPIYTIQGSGTSSPINGSTVATEGVVIGDFQGASNLSGFHVQDPSGDANTATSDGIYVFDGSSPALDVAVGDRVRVVGTVAETSGNTRINPALPTQICNTGNEPPAATVVDLPEPVDGDLERYENMRVLFTEALTATGNFTWGRFGELVLSADGRLFQQNSFDRPNTAGALARANLNERAYVVLDDGKSVQNPDPIPYQSADMTRRAGDTVTGLTGVLTFDFNEYRVHPTVAPVFVQANPRPAAPASVGGDLKAASANVLNYFNGGGMGGGFPTARGASSPAEFNRQRAKIISMLSTLDADVLGIVEMENDGGGAQSALQDLVNGLNDATAPGTYVGLHSPNPGTDLIQNAIIYKPASVTPVGAQVNDIDSAWAQARAPLAQTFRHSGNGEKFTFIVNHFTSKGCSSSDTGDDADKGDGQGCDNFQRTQQANRLLVFIQDRKTASGDPDVLSVGDYNAYGEEDPIFILEQDSADTLSDGTGGLVSQSERFVPAGERYSFQFDSQFGELDHALATKSMNNQITGATIWHVNADEPVAIDYNTEFKTQDLYAPSPYRAADHDPLVVGLSLSSAPPLAPGSLIISEFRLSGPAGANDEFVEVYNNTNSPVTVQTIDGSAGYALAASSGGIRFIIPNDTVIQARGYFLGVNNAAQGYSLASHPAGGGTTAAGDPVKDAGGNPAAGYTTDIPDNTGIALFSTANPVNFNTDTRLDAVGSASEANTLYKEGDGYPAIGGTAREYSFFRDLRSGLPKDTGDNASDFLYVNTLGTNEGAGGRLGAPGPQNLSSPVQRNAAIKASLINPFCGPGETGPAAANPTPGQSPDGTPVAGTCQNAARDSTPIATQPDTSARGTFYIRRRFHNKTGQNVTRLRFRVVDITTKPEAGTADLRVLSSGATQYTVNAAVMPLHGLTLEEPPAQAIGGGFNSTLQCCTGAGSVTGARGITLAEPLAPNGIIDVQFRFGVMAPGFYRFFVNVEAELQPAMMPIAPSKAGAQQIKR